MSLMVDIGAFAIFACQLAQRERSSNKINR